MTYSQLKRKVEKLLSYDLEALSLTRLDTLYERVSDFFYDLEELESESQKRVKKFEQLTKWREALEERQTDICILSHDKN